MKETVFLGLDEVIEIHSDQIRRNGGLPGIRDIELLKSAVSMPAAGFGENYLHTDIHEMAAAYLFHIVRNHPFLDGNKRAGAVAAIVFLMLNGIDINADENSLEMMVRSTAEGNSDKAAIARFFRDNSVCEGR